MIFNYIILFTYQYGCLLLSRTAISPAPATVTTANASIISIIRRIGWRLRSYSKRISTSLFTKKLTRMVWEMLRVSSVLSVESLNATSNTIAASTSGKRLWIRNGANSRFASRRIRSWQRWRTNIISAMRTWRSCASCKMEWYKGQKEIFGFFYDNKQ